MAAFSSSAFSTDGVAGGGQVVTTADSTLLIIVNKLLVQLREEEVSTVAANSYSKLLAMFVNQAKADMEDAWYWSCNEYELDIDILADGTREYSLLTTNDRSFLQRLEADQAPMAFDITDGEENMLQDIPLRALNRARASGNYDDPIPKPNTFAINPAANGRGYGIEMLYESDNERTWRMYWYIPQADLLTNGDDDNTNILLPGRPVFLKALYYALNERGEEMGEPGQIAEQRAKDALAAAMEIDMQVNKKSDVVDMTNLESLRNGIVGN